MSKTSIVNHVKSLLPIIERAKKVASIVSGDVANELNKFIKSAEELSDKIKDESESVDGEHKHMPDDDEVHPGDINKLPDLFDKIDKLPSDDEAAIEEVIDEAAKDDPGVQTYVQLEKDETFFDANGNKIKHEEAPLTPGWGNEEKNKEHDEHGRKKHTVSPLGPNSNVSKWVEEEIKEIGEEMENINKNMNKGAAKGKGIPLPKKKIKQNPNADSSKVQVPDNGGQALKASVIEKEVLANGSYKVGSTEIRVNGDMEVELWSDGSGRAASLADMDTVISDFIGIVDHKRKLEAASKFDYSTVTFVNVPCESCGEIAAHEFTKNASYECGCGHEIAPEGVNALVKLGHLTMAYGIRAEHKNEKQFSRIASILESASETDADQNSVFAIYASIDDANAAIAKLSQIGGIVVRASENTLSDLVKMWDALKTKLDAAKTVLEELENQKKELQNQMRESAGLAGQIGEKVVKVDGLLRKVVVRQKNNPSYAKTLDEIRILFPEVERVASLIVEKHSTRSDIIEVKKARKVAFSDDALMHGHELLGLLDEAIDILSNIESEDNVEETGEPDMGTLSEMEPDMGMRSAQLIPGAPIMQSGPKKKDDSDDEKSDEMPSEVPPSEAISAAFTNYKAQGMSMMKAIREFLKEHSGMVDGSSWSPGDDSAVISMLTKYWSGSKPTGLSDSAPLPVDDMPLMLQAQKLKMDPKIRKPKDHVSVGKKPLGKDSAGEELLPLPSGKIKQQVKPQGKMPKTDLGKDTSSMDWNDPGPASKGPKKFKMSDVVLDSDSEGNEPFATPALGSKPKSRK